MNSRERFLNALKCQSLDRPPIWVMRQAGRYLPEYRALKEKYTFLELAQTPELALEVTLQPLRRFRLDAAILFSDILVIPEAMGQSYHFRDTGGITMNFRLENRQQIEALDSTRIEEKLNYVSDALQLIHTELSGSKALLGFGGSPWTLATYMVEGGSSKNFEQIKSLFYSDRPTFDALMHKLTNSLIYYFKMQKAAGVDAIQIFDSWGGIIAGTEYEHASLKWIRRIIDAIGNEIPIILYAKGTSVHLSEQCATNPNAISVDWTISIEEASKRINGNIAIQGNLDPSILNTNPEIVRNQVLKILEAMRNRPGHIFNLGHGIHPTAKIENMEALVETVVGYKA
tara:strand:- start:15268 stop:16296 length:1029 start_codon:yes stop_codon:yes gene_type:complete